MKSTAWEPGWRGDLRLVLQGKRRIDGVQFLRISHGSDHQSFNWGFKCCEIILHNLQRFGLQSNPWSLYMRPEKRGWGLLGLGEWSLWRCLTLSMCIVQINKESLLLSFPTLLLYNVLCTRCIVTRRMLLHESWDASKFFMSNCLLGRGVWVRLASQSWDAIWHSMALNVDSIPKGRLWLSTTLEEWAPIWHHFDGGTKHINALSPKRM